MKILSIISLAICVILMSCQQPASMKKNSKTIKLVTLDPGHFHAALVQKSMYDDVDSVVHVYAPEGPEVQQHLNLIQSYNSRAENPTHWKEVLYTGSNFFEKMLSDRAGNVVVLAGNNQKKTENILKSLEAGFNVLADKPMAIDKNGFEMLKNAFMVAGKNKLLLYDIMTERYEITTLLQRELSMLPEVFGKLETGTPDNPAVTKESVHHFYKYVSGSILTRPPWFMDVTQQGEGIVDVTTHLVDLIQWECFPDQVIDYLKEIQLNSAKHWATEITLSEFRALTKLNGFPDYFSKNVVRDSVLQVLSNGEINYKIRGIHAKVSVIWNYKAPEGTGDTHYSIMRGSKANLIIRQGKDEKFIPELYLEPVTKDPSFEKVLTEQFKLVQNKYPGVELKKISKGWSVVIPEKYRVGHEAHFASVTQKYLQYLTEGNMPAWEVPNMIAKYFTTTQALELAKQK
jgi:predicted dehydrogenase